MADEYDVTQEDDPYADYTGYEDRIALAEQRRGEEWQEYRIPTPSISSQQYDMTEEDDPYRQQTGTGQPVNRLPQQIAPPPSPTQRLVNQGMRYPAYQQMQAAQQAQQQQAQQAQESQAELSMGDQKRINQYQNGLSYLDEQLDDGSITWDQYDQKKREIQAGLQPLQQRKAASEAAQQQKAMKAMQQQQVQGAATQAGGALELAKNVFGTTESPGLVQHDKDADGNVLGAVVVNPKDHSVTYHETGRNGEVVHQTSPYEAAVENKVAEMVEKPNVVEAPRPSGEGPVVFNGPYATLPDGRVFLGNEQVAGPGTGKKMYTLRSGSGMGARSQQMALTEREAQNLQDKLWLQQIPPAHQAEAMNALMRYRKAQEPKADDENVAREIKAPDGKVVGHIFKVDGKETFHPHKEDKAAIDKTNPPISNQELKGLHDAAYKEVVAEDLAARQKAGYVTDEKTLPEEHLKNNADDMHSRAMEKAKRKLAALQELRGVLRPQVSTPGSAEQATTETPASESGATRQLSPGAQSFQQAIQPNVDNMAKKAKAALEEAKKAREARMKVREDARDPNTGLIGNWSGGF